MSSFAAIGAALLVSASTALFSTPAAQSNPMTTPATGTFDVTVKPQPVDAGADAPAMGRMSLDKQFHGDLEGSSKGQMLTAMGAKESGVYVAVEQFVGTLHGRRGGFALHHTGVMTRGTPSLTVTVVPDSGTGQLEGIEGAMTIDIAKDGTHSYTLHYRIAPSP